MSESQKGWVGQLSSDSFSISQSIGGWRGAVESLLPGLIFVITYVITRDLTWTLVLSGGIAVLFVIIRLVQRTPITQAFAGLLGVGVGVVWAALSGRAENYFAWGLITNVAFFAAFLLSLVVRRSAIGLLIQFFYGLPANWRKSPVGQILGRRAVLATWVWVAVFGLRVAAQAPLYFGEHIVALGTVKLVLGLPLFAVGGWLTWVLLRGVLPAVTDRGEEKGSEAESDAASN